MWWQIQVISLSLSLGGLVLSLLPRAYPGKAQLGPFRLVPWPKLFKFAPFWIGAAVLAYVAAQSLNPWWKYATNGKVWWLVRLHELPWLPRGIESPFAKSNGWRVGVIWGDAWLLLCSIWVGVTERKTIRIIASALAINGVLLGALLIVQKGSGTVSIPWAPADYKDWAFCATFVYRNHAGAYFDLEVFLAASMMLWSFDHGEKTMKRSTPAATWASAMLFLVIVVILALSRGAIMVLVTVSGPFGLWLFFWRRRRPGLGSTDIRMKLIMAVLIFGSLAFAFRYLNFSEIYGRMTLMAAEGRHEPNVESRILARHAASDMLSATGWRGVGAGGFRFLFPEYTRAYPEIYTGNQFWSHAHCDWLEIPIEMGLVGSAILVAGFWWWIRLFFRLRVGWNTAVIPLLFGCTQTLIHAGFDFPFACPAVLLTWFAMLGMAGKWGELSPSGLSTQTSIALGPA